MATVYDKSSLFLAPSGVSNGTVFVQKPVPIYGSEQVTNGDFSQTGAEQVTNGDFDTDSDWTKQNGSSISGGVANVIAKGSLTTSAGNWALYQSGVLAPSKFYKVVFDARQTTGTGSFLSGQGYSNNFNQAITTSWVQYEYILPTSTNTGYGRDFICFGGLTLNDVFEVDNVSVKEVGQDWDLTDGCSITAQGARITSDGTFQSITQLSILTIGKTYEFEYEITEYVSGILSAEGAFGVGVLLEQTVGVHKLTANCISSNLLIKRAGSCDITITNISVQEVLSPAGDFTFTRGSNLSATRVNEAQLIEKGRENVILQSNQFDTSWSINGTTLTSGQTGYDGSSDAWLLEVTATGSYRRVYQSGINLDVNTFSIYAKANTSNFLFLLNNKSSTDAVAWFDLSNGSIGGVNGAIDTKIESVGNGWYRCSVTSIFADNQYFVSVADGISDVTATAGASLYIQDAQLEQGLVATSVITTGAVPAQAGLLENTPRLDYSGGATCPSLLLEPSRANLMNSSEYFRTPYWSEGGLDSLQSNVSTTADPTGGYGASKIIPNSTNTTAHSIIGNDVSTSTQYTASIFAKAAEYDYLWIRGLGLGGNGGARFNISTGVVEGFSDFASATIEDYGNGWYRCIATGTTPPATTTGPFYHPSPTASFTAYAGDGTSGIYTYGAQVEAAPYATSYIPTYGTSQTRADDECVGAGDSSTFNSSEGVLYAEVAAENITTFKNISINKEGTANRINFYIYSSSIVVNFDVDGVNQASLSYSIPNVTIFNKFAFSYKLNEFKLFVNGVQRVIDTSGAVPAVGTFNQLSFNDGFASKFFGKVKEVIYFPTALSDLDLAILTGATTYNTFDEMALALNYTVYE